MDQIINIALDKIEADPDQPRKYFDEAKLNELAVTIAEHGVRTPITVRPHPKKQGHHIINVGERRWRASQIAGKTDIPAIVDTSKHEPGLLLELQLIENSQRADIGPLEEGEAYLQLKKKYGHTVETLMARTGRSRSHVYSRMKLTELAEPVKKALGQGDIEPAIADLIATIGDAKLQEQALKDCQGKSDYNAYRDGHIEVETADGAKLPLSFRAARVLINTKYKLRLQLAPFDVADEKLTKAGACGPCHFRSGNQPELPGVSPTTKVDDMCQRPSCFQEKTKAAFDNAADSHKAMGHRVVQFKEAEKLSVFSWNKSELSSSSPWVDPKDTIPYDISGNYESKATWKGMLGAGDLAKIPRAFVQDVSGRGRELIDRGAAVDALRKSGKLKELKHKKAKPGEDNSDERAEEREKQKLREEAFLLVIEQARDAAKEISAKQELALWRWVVAALVADFSSYGEGEWLARRNGIEVSSVNNALADAVEGLKTVAHLRAFVVELLLCKNGYDIVEETGEADTMMGLAEKLFSLDWKKAELAAAAVAESLAESERAAKAAAKKPVEKMTDKCGKCGLEMGEHDGKKCPKPEKKKGGAK